jgi:hypothetical protein
MKETIEDLEAELDTPSDPTVEGGDGLGDSFVAESGEGSDDTAESH